MGWSGGPNRIGCHPDHGPSDDQRAQWPSGGRPADPVGRAEALLLAGLFERLPIVAGLNLAVALGTTAVFAGLQSPLTLGGWLLVMVLTLALRLQSWRAFRRAPADTATAPVWARRFTLGAAATGAAWGLAGVLLYAPETWPAQVFLPFVMAGMVGGSVTALTGHMPAYVAFSVCTLVPYALRLATEGDQPHLVMATLVVLYLAGMGVLGRSVNASLVASVRLAVENQGLVTALSEKSGQLEATFEHVHQGVAVFERDGRLATWNARHRELHGYPAELYRRGTHLGDFLRYDLARGGDFGPAASERMRLAGRRPAPARFEQPGADQRILDVERSAMPGGGFVSTSTDITERKRTEARMLHLAQHDPLTGLPNRLLFQDRLRQAMARCRRDRTLLAVVLVDLDRFKEVNDAFGHRVGDGVLKQVGERMRAALRESDTVARIGGDEFALVLPDLPDAEAAALIADKIVEPARSSLRARRRRLAAAREPRDRAVPDRRPEPRGAAPERRSGDVSGQGRGRRLPALRHRDQARFRPAAEPQARSRPRHPARPAQARISAAAGSPARARRRDRGPAALAAP